VNDGQPIETAPKDGREVYLELRTRWVKAYWDADLKTWVLSRQYQLDTFNDPERWQPVPRAEPSDFGIENS
jgi:hypothetical protein